MEIIAIRNDVVFVVWLADVDQLPAGGISRSGISAVVAYVVDARRARSGTFRGPQSRRPVVRPSPSTRCTS